MTTRICYYHAGCSDGFGAAWAIHHWLGDAYEYRPLQYGTDLDPDEHRNAELLFVDVTVSADNMRAICDAAGKVNVLDHHISAIRALQPLMDAGHFGGVFDTARSGAVIAWDWAAGLMSDAVPPPPAPRLLAYIQDRDLWRKELEYCDAIARWLRSYEFSFEVWDNLAAALDLDIYHTVAEARAIERYHDNLVDQLADRYRFIILAGYRVPAVNCPGAFASEVAGRLAKSYPFAVCYFDTADKRVYSLRSTIDGCDVSRIAEQFGGGGHKHAAGFTRPLYYDETDP